MYRITIQNGTTTTDIYNPRNDIYYVTEATVTKELNATDIFSFTVIEEFDKNLLKPRQSVITVYDENDILFRGRIISNSEDIYCYNTVECEGALAYFNDTYFPPFEHDGDVKSLLELIVADHNRNIESDKAFVVGEVTVTDDYGMMPNYSDEAISSLELIRNNIVDALGGYLTVTYENGKNVLNYISQLGKQSSQVIEIGSNLMDLVIDFDYRSIITRLYPYGAKDEETGVRIDITSVNDGIPYIEDTTYKSTYGTVSTYAYWDDITTADDLKTYATSKLVELSRPGVTVTVKAVDLHMMDTSIDKFELGDYILCKAPKNNLNEYFLLSEITYDLISPENSTISLGDTKTGLSSSVSSSMTNLTSQITQVVGKIEANTIEVSDLSAAVAAIESAYIGTANIDSIVAGKIQADSLIAAALDAKYATIAKLTAEYATIQNLNATNARVTTLEGKTANIENLNADVANIKELFATDAEIEQLEAQDLTVVGMLNATNGQIENLQSTKVDAGELDAYKATVTNLIAECVKIEELTASYITAADIQAEYATISALNAATANITTLQADVGLINEAIINKAEIEDLNVLQGQFNTLNATVANLNTVISNKVDTETLNAKVAEINNLIADEVNALEATITNLDAKYATVELLNAKYAELNELIANKATVDQLQAAEADIGTLEANLANINSVLAGNVGTGLLQTIHLTASNVVLDEAIISSANIVDLDVSKLRAGTISTDTIRIASDDGGMQIVGSTQQFTDAQGRVRLQIGRDAVGNFNFIVFGEDGTTAIYDQNGITRKAISNGLIVDQMVADDAGIAASKIKYVDIGGDTTLQTHLETVQGEIDALVRETTFTEGTNVHLDDGFILVFNDDTNPTIDSNGVLGFTDPSDLENQNGVVVYSGTQVVSIKDRIANINVTVDGIYQDVYDVEYGIDSMNSKISSIQQTADRINLKVSSIGGQNLFYYSSKEWLSKTVDNNLMFLGCYKDSTHEDMKGRKVTLSFEVRKNTSTTGTFDISCFYTNSDDIYDLKANVSLDDVSDDGRYILSFTYPDSPPIEFDQPSGEPMVTVVIDNANITGEFAIRKGMIQYGLIATEWIPTSDNVRDTLAAVEIESDKINWMVRSGTDSSNFELTDRTANLVAKHINLNGLVTFSGFDRDTQNIVTEASDRMDVWNNQEMGSIDPNVVEQSTLINGGFIFTNTILLNQLNVEDIFASGSAVMNIINAQEINASRITSGQIQADMINAYGLTVTDKETAIETFKIDEDGHVVIRGSLESYNYLPGIQGWSILEDGNAEFNDITVRGTLIANDGGIAYGLKKGTNLLLQTWQNNTASYDNEESAILFNCTTSTSFDLYQTITNRIRQNNTTRYTLSAYVKLDNYVAGTNPFATIDISGECTDAYGDISDLVVTSLSGDMNIIPHNNGGWVLIKETVSFVDTPSKVEVHIKIRNFNGTVRLKNIKLEEGNDATPYTTAPIDGYNRVKFWAGASYEEREYAPFRVYDDGKIFAQDGDFTGVVSGQVRIGNISIVDPNSIMGNDALLTIVNGNNGVKKVQLTDNNESIFAQDLVITDDFYNRNIILYQNGEGIFKESLTIGDPTSSVNITDRSISINGSIFETIGSTLKILNTTIDLGSPTMANTVNVYGYMNIENGAKVNSDIDLGEHFSVQVKANGMDLIWND